MHAILWPIITWLLRQVVIKFLVVAVIYEDLLVVVEQRAAGLDVVQNAVVQCRQQIL